MSHGAPQSPRASWNPFMVATVNMGLWRTIFDNRELENWNPSLRFTGRNSEDWVVCILLLFIFLMLLMKASFAFLHTHVNRLISWWWSPRKKITKLNIYKAHGFPKVWKRFYSPTLKTSRNLNILLSALFTLTSSNKYWVSLLLWTTSPNCFLDHCVEKDSEVTYSMYSSSLTHRCQFPVPEVIQACPSSLSIDALLHPSFFKMYIHRTFSDLS